MKPKEYAKELVEKYLPLVRNSDLYDTYFEKAKACALIDVQNTIDAGPHKEVPFLNSSDCTALESSKSYFEQVKTEIINLK